MATKIDDATLTITVNEDIKLNGHQLGSKVIETIGGINEASRRILSVPTRAASPPWPCSRQSWRHADLGGT